MSLQYMNKGFVPVDGYVLDFRNYGVIAYKDLIFVSLYERGSEHTDGYTRTGFLCQEGRDL